MFTNEIKRTTTGSLLARVHQLNVRRLNPLCQVPEAYETELRAIGAELLERYGATTQTRQATKALARSLVDGQRRGL
jgi:hypothetical protein